ncbi:hypothetical protein JXQ70_01460 [bacterium]|nr:hypothetical protein [bacterium]
MIDKPGIPADLWSAPRTLWGSSKYHIQAYKVEFVINGLKEEVIRTLDYLKMGQVEVPIEKQVTISVWKSPYPQFNNIPLSGNVYSVGFENDPPYVIYFGYFYAARFNLKTRQIDLFMADAQPKVLTGEVENFLRVSTSLFFISENVFPFHSSAVSLEGETFVFFGPHNAGKSTLAQLAPESSLVLGDDLNALILKEDGVYIASLPFPSEVMRIRPIAERRISALFRIVKDKTNYFEPMSPGEKIGALYASMPVYNVLPSDMRQESSSLFEISVRVPLCRLHFSKDEEVYPWLLKNLDSIPR